MASDTSKQCKTLWSHRNWCCLPSRDSKAVFFLTVVKVALVLGAPLLMLVVSCFCVLRINFFASQKRNPVFYSDFWLNGWRWQLAFFSLANVFGFVFASQSPTFHGRNYSWEDMRNVVNATWLIPSSLVPFGFSPTPKSTISSIRKQFFFVRKEEFWRQKGSKKQMNGSTMAISACKRYPFNHVVNKM